MDPLSTVVAPDSGRQRWWTWAGARANAVLVAAIHDVDADLLGDALTYDNWQIALRADATQAWLASVRSEVRRRFGPDLSGIVPLVDERAVKRLKFSEMLPAELAVATLAARTADPAGAAQVLARPVR